MHYNLSNKQANTYEKGFSLTKTVPTSLILIATYALFNTVWANEPKAIQARLKKALVLGANGQDGSYLLKMLMDKGYEVHGSVRPSSQKAAIDTIYKTHPESKKRLFIHYGALNDATYVKSLIEDIKPDEVYNLAAQSSVSVSFKKPLETFEANSLNVVVLLEALRGKPIRICQASTGEIFGKPYKTSKHEQSAYGPTSPYGISKLSAHQMIELYRKSYKLYACNAILFNHESPLREEHFITRKISKAVAKKALGAKEILSVGNLDAARDWGYVEDYVEAMWRCLQQPEADDYIIATGKMHTVREFIEKAFKHIGINVLWKNKGVDEIGIDPATGTTLIKIDPAFFRPTDYTRKAKPSKAFKKLRWRPKVSFEKLIQLMVDADKAQLKEANNPSRDLNS